MGNKLLVLAGAVVVAVTGASAQTALKGTIARTPDGHPDLTGVFDVQTMTPLQRLPGVTKLVLTPQEAATLEQYEAQRQVQNDAPLDPNRGAPDVGGDKTVPKTYQEVLERAGGGVVGGYNHFWLAEGKSYITVNGEKRSSIIVDPPDGHIPPMKPEARERNRRFLAENASPSGACSDSGRRPDRRRCRTTSTTTSSRSCRPRTRSSCSTRWSTMPASSA